MRWCRAPQLSSETEVSIALFCQLCLTHYTAVRTCNFGNFLEQALRDCLVCGMTNSSTLKKLLAEKDLNLQRAVDIATAAKMAVLYQQQTCQTKLMFTVLVLQSYAIVVGREDIWLVSTNFAKKSVSSAGSKAAYQGCAKNK